MKRIKISILVIAKSSSVTAKEEKPALRSTYDLLKAKPEGTFHGFSGRTSSSAIDFIFVEPTRWKVTKTTVMKTTYAAADGAARYVSDHFPVSVTLEPAK